MSLQDLIIKDSFKSDDKAIGGVPLFLAKEDMMKTAPYLLEIQDHCPSLL